MWQDIKGLQKYGGRYTVLLMNTCPGGGGERGTGSSNRTLSLRRGGFEHRYCPGDGGNLNSRNFKGSNAQGVSPGGRVDRYRFSYR